MHDDVLTNHAKALAPLLPHFKGFYLVGGTALALQIGHRVSVDFDLFTKEALSPRLMTQVNRLFADFSIETTYRSSEQINLIVNGVHATFFSYPYPVIDEFVNYRGISIVSVREIAAMKAFAIGKRLAYKDYVDWYFMLHDEHVSLHEAIDHAKKKYGHDFNDRLFLGQLVSMSEVPTSEIDFIGDHIDRATIEEFLTQTVRDFV